MPEIPFPSQRAQVSFIQRNEPIQAFTPQAADESFTIGVGLRRPDGSFQDGDSEGLQITVQISREDTGPVVDQPTIRVVAGDRFSELLQSPR